MVVIEHHKGIHLVIKIKIFIQHFVHYCTKYTRIQYTGRIYGYEYNFKLTQRIVMKYCSLSRVPTETPANSRPPAASIFLIKVIQAVATLYGYSTILQEQNTSRVIFITLSRPRADLTIYPDTISIRPSLMYWNDLFSLLWIRRDYLPSYIGCCVVDFRKCHMSSAIR